MSVLRKYVRNIYMHMLVFLICLLDNSASAQNIPLQHFTWEYSKVSLFILSQGKAVARNDNKREILRYHNLVSTSIGGKRNMVGRDDDETSQDKDK